MAVSAPNTGAPSRATPTPFAQAYARHTAALARFNALPSSFEDTDPDAHKREEDAFLEASRALDQTPPGTWAELAIAMEHMLAKGANPGWDLCDRLVADAKRLLDAPPTIGAADLYALDRAMMRVDHVAATTDLMAEVADGLGAAALASAMRGVGATLSEQARAINQVLEPHRRARGAR